MTRIRILLAKLLSLFRRTGAERDMEEEFEFHLRQEIELHVSRGMSIEEARRLARLRFGSVDAAKESYREARGVSWLEVFLRDCAYGIRVLARNPGFAAAAVTSLALGIGVNCSVFTLTNAVLIRDLPVKNPDRLARILAFGDRGAADWSYPVFREISERQHVMQLTASGGADYEHVVFRGRELQEAGELNAAVVSANYFEVLGVPAEKGRVFTQADSAHPGEGFVLVLGYRFWESRLGGDASVLGEPLVLDGTPFTIIGIAAAAFGGDRLGGSRDFWIPILTSPRERLESRTTVFFRTIGRLNSGVSEDDARAELTDLYREAVAQQNAAGTGSLINRDRAATVRVDVQTGTTGLNPVRNQSRRPLLLLTGVVALVLLIACSNVANLLLARNAARQHEIGVRLAVGAGRRRLIAQLLSESFLLSTIGAAIGLASAVSGTRLLFGGPAGLLPAGLDLAPDWRVFLFTAALSLGATTLFGLLPALRTASNETLSQWHGNRAAGRSRRRTSRVLAAVQAGLALWLLIGAGLLIQSLRNLRAADIGLDRRHVAIFELSAERGFDVARSPELMRDISERLQAASGVRSTAFSLYGLFADGVTTAPARVPASHAADRQMRMGWVSPGFFRTLGMELLLGREFNDRDKLGAPLVGILSEAGARYYFGDRSPIGESVYFPAIDERNRYIPFSKDLAEARRVEIIGVVRDARDRGPRQPATTGIYLPVSQQTRFAPTMYVRTDRDPGALAAQLLPILKEYSGKVRVRASGTVEDQLDGGIQMERLLARMLGFFAALALALAVVGLYGVTAYTVSRRTGEIGIRLALGGRPIGVLSMVLRESLLMIAAGMALGIVAALATMRFLQSMLFGLTPTDPFTIAVVAAIFIAAAGIASYVPARRASRVDPVIALRHE